MFYYVNDFFSVYFLFSKVMQCLKSLTAPYIFPIIIIII